MADTAVFDVDGTLVDTNYQHALTWYQAFRRYEITVPVWQIHRHIGMGGDQIVAALAGDVIERRHGDGLRAAWTEQYEPMLADIQPFDGAHELLVEIKRRGFRLVLASSGKAVQVEYYLDLIDGKPLADAWTSSDDVEQTKVEQTKPAPDLVQVAIDKVDGASAVLVGDSTWDFLAAGKLGVAGLAVRTGGFSAEELHQAGAAGVYDNLGELHADLDGGPLGAPTDD